jgi:hypothetical protein
MLISLFCWYLFANKLFLKFSNIEAYITLPLKILSWILFHIVAKILITNWDFWKLSKGHICLSGKVDQWVCLIHLLPFCNSWFDPIFDQINSVNGVTRHIGQKIAPNRPKSSKISNIAPNRPKFPKSPKMAPYNIYYRDKNCRYLGLIWFVR